MYSYLIFGLCCFAIVCREAQNGLPAYAKTTETITTLAGKANYYFHWNAQTINRRLLRSMTTLLNIEPHLSVARMYYMRQRQQQIQRIISLLFWWHFACVIATAWFKSVRWSIFGSAWAFLIGWCECMCAQPEGSALYAQYARRVKLPYAQTRDLSMSERTVFDFISAGKHETNVSSQASVCFLSFAWLYDVSFITRACLGRQHFAVANKHKKVAARPSGCHAATN